MIEVHSVTPTPAAWVGSQRLIKMWGRVSPEILGHWQICLLLKHNQVDDTKGNFSSLLSQQSNIRTHPSSPTDVN